MEYSEIQSKNKEELLKIAEEHKLIKNGESTKKSYLVNIIYYICSISMIFTKTIQIIYSITFFL